MPKIDEKMVNLHTFLVFYHFGYFTKEKMYSKDTNNFQECQAAALETQRSPKQVEMKKKQLHIKTNVI